MIETWALLIFWFSPPYFASISGFDSKERCAAVYESMTAPMRYTPKDWRCVKTAKRRPPVLVDKKGEVCDPWQQISLTQGTCQWCSDFVDIRGKLTQVRMNCQPPRSGEGE